MARIAATALICLSLALPALAQAQDAPIATQAAPKPPPETPTSAPTDDYGYVAWCYGAVGGYVAQYDKAMPEVARIERAFPTPSTEENIAKVYPEQRDAAKASLILYRQALTAAEKASARPINAVGAQAVARGQAIWNGASIVTPAQLGQFYMGWAPPADCDTRAKALEAKSTLFGQALTFNTVAPPAAPAVEAPVVEAPVVEAQPTVAPAEIAPVAPTPAAPSSIDTLLDAAASGQGASADAVLQGAKPAPKPALRGAK
jgi:hypothetical protein